jgi:hypothetical protein
MVDPMIPPRQHHLDAEKVYIETARRLSAAQQLATLHALQQSALALKTSLLRSEHPDLSEQEVRKLVRDNFLYAAS